MVILINWHIVDMRIGWIVVLISDKPCGCYVTSFENKHICSITPRYIEVKVRHYLLFNVLSSKNKIGTLIFFTLFQSFLSKKPFKDL